MHTAKELLEILTSFELNMNLYYIILGRCSVTLTTFKGVNEYIQ